MEIILVVGCFSFVVRTSSPTLNSTNTSNTNRRATWPKVHLYGKVSGTLPSYRTAPP